MSGIAVSPSNHWHLQTQNTPTKLRNKTINPNLFVQFKNKQNPSNGRHPVLSFAIDPSKTQTQQTPIASTSPPPLVVVGSANADIYVEIDRLPLEGETISAKTGQTLAGGKGANQAACGGKLSYPTYFVGQVGDDAHGKLITEALENGGVRLDYIKTVDAAPTGHAVVMLQPDGQNSIIIVGGANMNCWPEPLAERELEVVRNAGIVLLQREIPDSVNIQVAKLAIQKAISIKDSSTLMQVDQNETSIVVRDEMQNGGFAHAETIIYHSKKLQDDLQMLGTKIKEHEDSIKFLKTQKNKLDDSILDLQVKCRSLSTATIEHENNSQLQTGEQTTAQILQHEKSAAGILCQLKTRLGTQASHLPLTKDVLGIVATLGKVDDDNLSRLFAEYLGVESMLAIVCKTYEGVKALETYDKEGCINTSSGLHGLGASIGRALDGRFLVICLENLIPYAGGFVADDPQRRLDLIKPRLPNGECPPGFLGFAVNMINVDNTNLFCLTASGYGLRETLFYNLFSRLQIYRTRAEMVLALPCISDGALSLDGGMIRSTGVFSLGNREDVDVKFPKPSVTSTLPENYIEAEKQVKETKWKKEKVLEDLKRQEALLHAAKFNFDKKKQEFLKFLAETSSYATQHQIQGSTR